MRNQFFLFLRVAQMGLVLVAATLLSHAITAHAGPSNSPPYGATECAAERFGSNLGCTASNVSINSIVPASGSPTSCVGGQPITLNFNVTVNFGQSKEYDIGIFIANDGNNPKLLSTSGGAASCSVSVLPVPPFYDLNTNLCGDGNKKLSAMFTMSSVQVMCTTGGSGNTLNIPYLVSWNPKSSSICSDNTSPVPETSSQCNIGTVTFPFGTSITVLPTISLTDGVSTVRSGDTLTYTAVITNATSSTVTGAVFTDPAVTNLSLSSVNCTASGGATCPAISTVSSMQGSGIALPSMPNNSSLTFTVVGTYTGTPTNPTTLTNTADVTVSGQTNTASDTDTVMVPPTVTKAFSPSTIPVGGTSTLTITLANSTTSFDITGAALTDNYPTSINNTGSPALTNTCGGTATAAANGTSLSLSGATIPKGSSCSVSAQVTATTTGINSTGTVSASNAATGAAATATLTVLGIVAPGSFNAFETSTPAGAITGVVQTKISGSAFSLDVVAINGNVQASTFTSPVKVDLLGNTITGISLGSNYCPTSYTLLQTIFPTIVNGRSTINFSAVSDAWKDVRVRISYPSAGSPTVMSCSNDDFAIRPDSFYPTSASDNDWATAGTARTLYNTSTTGGNVHKAGQPFTLSATAVNAAGTTTTNYAGTPTATVTACILPASCTPGTLTTGTWGTTSGVVTSNTANYSEVGTITLQLVDSTFAQVDATDGSTPAQMTITSAPFNIGRFVPDHFDLTPGNTPQFLTFNASDTQCNSNAATPKRSFTYIGQPFGYLTPPQAIVYARNASGNTTTNYGNTPVGATSYVNTPSTPNTLDTTGTTLPTVTMTAGTGTGLASINASDFLAYVRYLTAPQAPQAPFNANISLTMSVTDSSESTVSGNGIIQTGTNAVFNGTGSGIAFDSGNLFEYGRLNLNNASGTVNLNLPVPMRAQVWNGSNFVNNNADNCTLLVASNIAMGNYQKNLAPCKTAISTSNPLLSGISNLNLNAPGAGNNGSVDLTVNLSGASTGQTCLISGGTQSTTSVAGLSWLQGKWSGTSYDLNPVARATFGIYTNANQFIFMQEMY